LAREKHGTAVRAGRGCGIAGRHRSEATPMSGSAHELGLGEATLGVNVGEHGAVAGRRRAGK
jgi:hypothetical protein